MKLPKIVKFLLFVGLLSTGADSVRSEQLETTITLQENRVGSRIQNSHGFNVSIEGLPMPDSGPGGLSAALTFDLLNPPGLVVGDLWLLTDSLAISDVIRFNPTDIGGSVVFYSQVTPGPVDLAETGFPTLNYSNLLSIPEDPSGTTIYTPTAGQPGFVESASGLVRYVISSAETSAIGVPENGSTILLLGLAICVLIFPVRARAVARVRHQSSRCRPIRSVR